MTEPTLTITPNTVDPVAVNGIAERLNFELLRCAVQQLNFFKFGFTEHDVKETMLDITGLEFRHTPSTKQTPASGERMDLITVLIDTANELEAGRQVWVTSTLLRKAAAMLAAEAVPSPCQHTNLHVDWIYLQCKDCGAVKHDQAGPEWHASLEDAKRHINGGK